MLLVDGGSRISDSQGSDMDARAVTPDETET